MMPGHFRSPSSELQDRAAPTSHRICGCGLRGQRGPPRESGMYARSLGKPPKHSSITVVQPVDDPLEPAPAGCVSDRRHNEHISVRGDLYFATVIESKLLKQRLVEDECHAVAGASKLLDHRLYSIRCSYVQ